MLELVRRDVRFDGPIPLGEAKELFARMFDESQSKSFVGSRVHFCEGRIVLVYEDRQYARK